MEEQLILSKPHMELQVTIYHNRVSVLPLPSSTMPKELLYNIATTVEVTAQYYLIKQRTSFNDLYTNLLVYFNSQGWLVKQVDKAK